MSRTRFTTGTTGSIAGMDRTVEMSCGPRPRAACQAPRPGSRATSPAAECHRPVHGAPRSTSSSSSSDSNGSPGAIVLLRRLRPWRPPSGCTGGRGGGRSPTGGGGSGERMTERPYEEDRVLGYGAERKAGGGSPARAMPGMQARRRDRGKGQGRDDPREREGVGGRRRSGGTPDAEPLTTSLDKKFGSATLYRLIHASAPAMGKRP